MTGGLRGSNNYEAKEKMLLKICLGISLSQTSRYISAFSFIFFTAICGAITDSIASSLRRVQFPFLVIMLRFVQEFNFRDYLQP